MSINESAHHNGLDPEIQACYWTTTVEINGSFRGLVNVLLVEMFIRMEDYGGAGRVSNLRIKRLSQKMRSLSCSPPEKW